MNIEQGIFTNSGTWADNNYELYIRFNSTDSAVIQAALARLWSHPNLRGCYLRRDLEPASQDLLSAEQISLSTQHVYGIAVLPDNKQFACATYPMIFDGEYACFNLAIPFGSLKRKYEIGSYPFGDTCSLAWQKIMDDWFCNIAQYIFEEVQFSFAAFGFIDCENLEEVAASELTEERYFGIIKGNNGQMQIHYPTIYEYPFKLGE